MKRINILALLIGLFAGMTKANPKIKMDNELSAVTDSVAKKVIDPVCRMKIKPAGSKTGVYNKVTYYFCSESCKQKFVAEPFRYLKK